MSAYEELQALMSGEKKLEAIEEDFQPADEDGEEIERDINYEDTEGQETEDVDDAEPNDESDDDDQDNEEGTTEEDSENTQVDDDSEKSEDDESTDDNDEADTNDTNEADGDGQTAEEDQETEEVDYEKLKSDYEKLQADYDKTKAFYDKVTSDFKASGTMVKGIDDPEKIRQMISMGQNYGEKNAALKPYRPFLKTLKELGVIEKPELFDYAIDILKKDKNAIKHAVKDSGIDTDELLELESNEVNYTPSVHRESQAEIVLDDLMDTARVQGIDAKFTTELGDKWAKDNSLNDILENPEKGAAIISHMSQVNEDGSTVYDEIMSRVVQNRMTDQYGTYANKPLVKQYEEAGAQLQSEYQEQTRIQQLEQVKVNQQKVNAEKAKIAAQREAEEYRIKAEQEKKKVEEARKKAASFSKPKPKKKPKKSFDPIEKSQELVGDDLMEYFNKSILGRGY